LSFNLQAQFKPKWSIGFTVMPQGYSRFLYHSYSSSISEYNPQNTDIGGLGFSAGPLIKLDFTKRLSLQSGLIYNKFWFWNKESIHKYFIGRLNHPPYTEYYSEKKFYTICYHSNLQIPLILKYKMMVKEKFYWDLGLGFSWNIIQFVQEKFVYTDKLGKTTTEIKEESHFSFKPYFRINTGFGFKVKKKDIVFDIDYTVSPYYETEGRYYYSLGAGLSLMF